MDLTRELFCRPISRLLLRMDKEPDALYVGVTPDEENPGRLSLSKITPCLGKDELAYTVSVEAGKVRLEAGEGWAEFAIALPNRLLIRAHGLTLLFGNGKGASVFMGGGSAVKDAYNPGGAMLSASGVKLRFIPKKGDIEVIAGWQLETLADPDPRVYLHPDENDDLDVIMYESDYDQPCPDDGMTVDTAATETVGEFEKFLQTIKLPSENEAYLKAAYYIWAALQPARDLSEKRITAPEDTAGSGGAAIAELSDSVLLSLLFKDKATALAQLG